MNSAQVSDLAYFLGDLSQIENFYEIKLPLKLTTTKKWLFLHQPSVTTYLTKKTCQKEQLCSLKGSKIILVRKISRKPLWRLLMLKMRPLDQLKKARLVAMLFSRRKTGAAIELVAKMKEKLGESKKFKIKGAEGFRRKGEDCLFESYSYYFEIGQNCEAKL